MVVSVKCTHCHEFFKMSGLSRHEKKCKKLDHVISVFKQTADQNDNNQDCEFEFANEEESINLDETTDPDFETDTVDLFGNTSLPDVRPVDAALLKLQRDTGISNGTASAVARYGPISCMIDLLFYKNNFCFIRFYFNFEDFEFDLYEFVRRFHNHFLETDAFVKVAHQKKKCWTALKHPLLQ